MLNFTTGPYDYYGPINYIDAASSRLDRGIDSGLRKESPDETNRKSQPWVACNKWWMRCWMIERKEEQNWWISSSLVHNNLLRDNVYQLKGKLQVDDFCLEISRDLAE